MDWSCGDIPAKSKNHGEERSVRGNAQSEMKEEAEEGVGGG